MTRQDPDVHEVRARVRKVLALLRVLAGHRGSARVTWWGQGFVYTVTAHRAGPVHLDIDADPDALGGDDARALLRDALGYPDTP